MAVCWPVVTASIITEAAPAPHWPAALESAFIIMATGRLPLYCNSKPVSGSAVSCSVCTAALFCCTGVLSASETAALLLCPSAALLPQPLSRAAPKESAAAAARIFFMRFTSFKKAA